MVTVMLTDSGIYMHYAQHKRCLARQDSKIDEWSPSRPCEGACEARLMEHLMRTGKKSSWRQRG